MYVDEANDAVNVRNHLTVNSTSLSANSTYPLYVNGKARANSYYTTSNTTNHISPASSTEAARLKGYIHLENVSSSSEPSVGSNYYNGWIWAGIESSGYGGVYVMDGQGNKTNISPHNADGDWVFHSTNKRTKKRTRINMIKLIRKIEELTGEEFIMEDFVE